MSDKPRMLIEVAMPVKEVSFESVRDKSLRHGHISTLHFVVGTTPLARMCYGVREFGSDPEDERCPQAFLMRWIADWVKSQRALPLSHQPYEDIPQGVDKMPDTLQQSMLTVSSATTHPE